MDAQRTDIARKCLAAAHDGAMSFPAIVGALTEAGYESYTVDYRQNMSTFYMPNGDAVAFDMTVAAEPVAPVFDAGAIAEQVRWAQANPPGYSYATFCRNVKASGCAGYMVSFSGRRVLYFGRTAETHVEHFPR